MGNIMKKIGLEDFTQYHFLSNLSITPCKGKLLFIDTAVNEDKSDYKQRIMRYDIKTEKLDVLVDYQKRTPFYMVGCGDLLVVKDTSEEDKTVHTTFNRIKPKDGEILKTFNLPLEVNSIKSLDDNHYLISATIDTKAPDYYLYNEDEKKKYHDSLKENEDYIIFDEYPYTFNGAGIINGNRTALFICDKETLKLHRITAPSMDVESYDFENGHIVYSGTDYTVYKKKFASIYDYDIAADTTAVLYDRQDMIISRVFYSDHKLTVTGTYGKEVGWIENAKFYELNDGKMELVLDSDTSLYNSVGTDARFGKLKNYYKDENGISYFTSTVGGNSVLYKYINHELVALNEFTGTVDDFIIGDEIYCIAMVNQDLEDLYVLRDKKPYRLTEINDLSEYYVAKPIHVRVNKPVPVDGWVLLPEDFDENKKYPAILDIHGGPKCAYGEIFYHEMQYWVNLGYVVFFSNPRGGDGKGNQFADLRRFWGGIDYEDIMDFTDEVLRLYPNIDRERLGVTGGSYGGYMTNWIVSQTNRFKAAATQRSISNWITEVTISDYGVDFPYEMQFTDINNCHDELWAMSPLKYANNVKTPLLFIHSTEDYRCTFPEALQYYTALRCRGVETKLVGFKGENHELSRSGKPKHRIKRLYEITEWMNNHLL